MRDDIPTECSWTAICILIGVNAKFESQIKEGESEAGMRSSRVTFGKAPEKLECEHGEKKDEMK